VELQLERAPELAVHVARVERVAEPGAGRLVDDGKHDGVAVHDAVLRDQPGLLPGLAHGRVGEPECDRAPVGQELEDDALAAAGRVVPGAAQRGPRPQRRARDERVARPAAIVRAGGSAGQRQHQHADEPSGSTYPSSP
jgi:hypothetical protein